jgi:hypothetical protein
MRNDSLLQEAAPIQKSGFTPAPILAALWRAEAPPVKSTDGAIFPMGKVGQPVVRCVT